MFIHLPMLFIVFPLSFVDCTPSIIEDSMSVSLSVKEIPMVLVVLEILEPTFSFLDPHMCTFTMLV